MTAQTDQAGRTAQTDDAGRTARTDEAGRTAGTVGRASDPSAGSASQGTAGAAGGAVSWAQLEQVAGDLAAEVRRCFTVRKHCTMATLRADGAPRISGTEVQFEDGQLWIGSMAGARKARDLQRDPRVALHSPTVDPPEGDESSWAGEAKVAGTAVEVTGQDAPEDGSHRFRIDLHDVVLTRVDGDALLIRSWHAGRGEQSTRRS